MRMARVSKALLARVAKALLFVLLIVVYNATNALVAGELDFSSRKLLSTLEGDAEGNPEGMKECNNRDIGIDQAPETPSKGIPGFSVQITNLCTGNCTMYDMHLSCGAFASTKLVNPKVFKRIGYNDCLVNGRNDLKPDAVISFRYYNSFKYPLKVSSFKCR